jgi:hypothetical protein
MKITQGKGDVFLSKGQSYPFRLLTYDKRYNLPNK